MYGLLAGAVLWASSALAAPMSMITGDYTSQPIGHYDFCERNPAECRIEMRDKGPLTMTRAVWQMIVDINVSVNQAIAPLDDLAIYGLEEFWDYPVDVGDCEDYVLEKRRLLHAAGIPLSNLLITVVRKPDREGHAVLTVRTDHGDFILDNLTDAVLPWQETRYTFLKRQAATHTGRWVLIDGFQSPLVSAVE